jgi:penicillin-binding protein 1C
MKAKWLKVGKAGWLAAGLTLLALAAATFAWWLRPAVFLPTFARVKAAHTRSEALLLDRNGEVIHELRTDSNGRRMDWVKLEEISPALKSSILAAEDRRFYDHGGVDWISAASALGGILSRGNPRGASTISMQLAARLVEELQPQAVRRSFRQKLRQVEAARVLEGHWSKPEILEAYLNLITFRGELEGIGAASRGLFGRQPHGLGEIESLILAALVRSPNASAEQVEKRAQNLAAGMRLGLDPSEIRTRIEETLARPYFLQPQASLAPHVARQLLQRDSVSVACTLDGKLQRFAMETLRRQLEAIRAQNVNDGALLVADNRTGEILAYVGNDAEKSSARYVDGITAARQAGSTLKPLIYGLAFEKKLITPVSLLEDSPLDIPIQGGVYRPKNYDNQFHGTVTARIALASSLNVPAVRTLNLTGVDAAVDLLAAAGIRNLKPAEYYGPSLALGAADVTLWDLVNAYRTLANRGIFSPMHLHPSPGTQGSRRVLSAASAFLISDILSDRESRSMTFSLENPLSTRFWTAVKTGTSKDMRDNWCVGYSSRYTVGVWVGNFSGQPMWDVSGITGAAPVWVEIMNWLHRSDPALPPDIPPGVVSAKVNLVHAGSHRREWFIKGTENAFVEKAVVHMDGRIVYPASGTVIALDPDIPRDEQKLFLEAQPASSSLSWILDTTALGDAGSLRLWSPIRGRHQLMLQDASGRVVDQVSFEVRGGFERREK